MKSSVTCPFVFNSDYFLFIIIIIKFGITGCYTMCLRRMFGGDFGDQIGRFTTLTDPKSNHFEVLVERINGHFFLTKGWKAIRDFYGIGLGAWVTLIFVVVGRFDMVLNDRFHKTIKYPVFDPPMHFLFDKTNVQTTFNDHLPP